MWKSLFVTTGDVLVFIDADLARLGHPLRARAARAAADRPARSRWSRGSTSGRCSTATARLGAFEGGRVTELVARPLIALLFPELAGLVQPLAGEWAVRRSHFASLPVPTGYAVELAALVDTVAALGLDAIAQVDLGRRAHRHQALRDLGAMATQIIAAAERRTGRAGRRTTVALRQYHPGARRRRRRARCRSWERPPAARSSPERCAMTLKLGRHEFADDATLMMAIVNRTPDSFYDKGATWAEDKAFDRVAQVVDEGAEIVDIGGIKAAPGVEIDAAEERRRVVDFVARVRVGVPRPGDQRRHLARRGRPRGLRRRAPTCSTTPGAAPTPAWSTSPPSSAPRSSAPTPAASRRAPARSASSTPTWSPRRSPTPPPTPSARSPPASTARSVVIDPAHDFGKNTFHSLEVTRRLGEMTATGWPVLVSLSNKDFVGETLDLPVGERLTGTLAATAVCALAGARIYRVHEVVETRQVVDMVWRDRRAPAAAHGRPGAGMSAARTSSWSPRRWRCCRSTPASTTRSPTLAGRLPRRGGLAGRAAPRRGRPCWPRRRGRTTWPAACRSRPVHRIGRHLLPEAGFDGARRATAAPGLLVVANGTADRSEKAPGHLDERAFGLRRGRRGRRSAPGTRRRCATLDTALGRGAVALRRRRCSGQLGAAGAGAFDGRGGLRRRSLRGAVLGGEVDMRVLIDRLDRSRRSTVTLDDDRLRELYAVPRLPWLRANMVQTVDGAATGANGKSGSINNAADKRVFDTAPGLADAIVVGAGTARAEGYRADRRCRPCWSAARGRGARDCLRDAPPGTVLMVTCAEAPALAETTRAARGRQRDRRWGRTPSTSARVRAALVERGLPEPAVRGRAAAAHRAARRPARSTSCASPWCPALVGAASTRGSPAGPTLDAAAGSSACCSRRTAPCSAAG